MILPARRGHPLRRNYRTYRGLGFSYYDLLNQTDREVCDPRDSACVGRNQQQVNAVQELWNSQYLGKTDAQMGPIPNIDLNIDTSAAATQRFMANQPVDAGITFISGGPVADLSSGIPRGQVGPAPKATGAVIQTAAGSAPVTQAGQTIVTSSGAQNAPGGPVAAPGSSSIATMVSAIPMWGWLAGAGVALFAFGGNRGR